MGKKARAKRKERQVELRVDFGMTQGISGLRPNPDGTLTFLGSDGVAVHPVGIEVGSSYSRDTKGPKVITRAPARPTSIALDPNRLLEQFDAVLAIDTNTHQVGERRISVSVAVWLHDLVNLEPAWTVNISAQPAFEVRDPTVAPEIIGWRNLLGRLEPLLARGSRVGLIVDFNLDRLNRLNARLDPINDDFKLPAGVTFLFATSDAGTKEYAANAALAACDRMASRILVRSVQEPDSSCEPASPTAPFSAWRYWPNHPRPWWLETDGSAV